MNFYTPNIYFANYRKSKIVYIVQYLQYTFIEALKLLSNIKLEAKTTTLKFQLVKKSWPAFNIKWKTIMSKKLNWLM